MESASRTGETGMSALRVADAMSPGLIHCRASDSLRAVAELMTRQRVHCIVVIEDPEGTESLWGIVSALDLVAASTVRPLDLQTAGGSAMSPALTIAPGARLAEAAELMTKHGVSHLVIVDRAHERPLGVISTLDVAAALSAAEPPADAYFSAPGIRHAADSLL